MNITYKVTEVNSRTSSSNRRRRRSVLYVNITNQDFAKPVAELFSGFRRNNPHKDYRKHVLPKAFELLGLPTNTKAAWSQKAGCSCGCSPGFVLSNVHPVQNFWADVEMTITGQMEMALENS